MIQIFHNPRCSKSRESLGILEKNQAHYEIIEYLQNPPTVLELKSIIKLLKITPFDLVRKG